MKYPTPTDPDDAIPLELQDVDTHPIARGAKILVVDDTPANLLAAEVALAPLQRELVLASSGRDALGHLLEQDFAMVLLDVQMPEMDGFETARWIRSREKTQHLPIIFVTAYDRDDSAVRRAYSLGAVDFLFKPVIPEVLLAKAAVFVALRERTEELLLARMEREFENRRRDYEAAALRRERQRELAAFEELARLNAALATHDRRKDEFLAILAHELRNPLAPLRTCVDLAREDRAQALTPAMLDVVERQTAVLCRLVDDLLDLSRIKADKVELRPEAIDLREVADAAISTCSPAIRKRAHTIVVMRPPDRVMVVADRVRLAQVISNLVNNAAKYTEPGGNIEVTVGVADGERAFVRVRDDGIGIPAELVDSVFEMFVQERVRSDGSGGLGLGLALSRRLAELHHGSLTGASEGPGKGSTFELRVPRVGAPFALPIRRRTRDLEPLRDLDLLRAPRDGANVRAVVIDDNDDARELLSALLRRKGFEVLTAADGPTGLGLIRDRQPHIALVDLGLPRLDGYGIAETLRRECPDLKTRLIALTGYGQANDQHRTHDAGFHAHLVKPASAAAIFACVSEQLART